MLTTAPMTTLATATTMAALPVAVGPLAMAIPVAATATQNRTQVMVRMGLATSNQLWLAMATRLAHLDKLGKLDKLSLMVTGLAVRARYTQPGRHPIKLVNLISAATGARMDELTPAQVAKRLGVSPSTIRRYEERGILVPTRRLPGSGYRRYSEEAVKEAERRIAAGEFD